METAHMSSILVRETMLWRAHFGNRTDDRPKLTYRSDTTFRLYNLYALGYDQYKVTVVQPRLRPLRTMSKYEEFELVRVAGYGRSMMDIAGQFLSICEDHINGRQK